MEEDVIALAEIRGLLFRRKRMLKAPKAPVVHWRWARWSPLRRRKHRLVHWVRHRITQSGEMSPSWRDKGLGEVGGRIPACPCKKLSFYTTPYSGPAAQASEVWNQLHLATKNIQAPGNLSVTHVGNYSLHPVLRAVSALQKIKRCEPGPTQPLLSLILHLGNSW